MKTQRKEMQAKRAEIEADLQANEDEIAQIIAEKNVIDQEIGILYAEIVNINDTIAAYNLLIADKQDELDNAQERFDELSRQNKERIRAMEEKGSISYWAVIFQANSFSDLLDRLTMVNEIAEADQRRLDELGKAADAVSEAKDELSVEKQAQEVIRAELDAAEAELEVKRQEADQVLTQLIAKGAEFEMLMDESEALQDELMKEIAIAEAEYKQALHQEWLATYVPPTTWPSQDVTPSEKPPSSSGWVCPVPYYTLTSPFGERVHPVLGYKRMHNGIDMAAATGTPVYAAKSGRVTLTSFQAGGAGNYVSINHGDGFSSVYMHLNSYIVSPGQYVNAGQVIGYVGSTGLSTGPHLHFGISYNGKYVNPLAYI
jgi:murein DD-endopeptidase MepM/ murein hydrolase activator NlpD